MKTNIFVGFTCLLTACGVTPAGRNKSAEPHGLASVADQGCQEKTCLAAINVEPDHSVEFHQFDSGLVGILEKGRADQRPLLKAMATTDLVSLAETYRQLKPGAKVPEPLLAADARYQSILLTMKEQTNLATARVHREIELYPERARAIEEAARPAPPPERAPSMGEESHFYSPSQQAWFKQTFCVPKGLQQCYQGLSTWIDSGTVVQNVKSWSSFAWVGSESNKSGTFLMEHLVTNGIWATDFTGILQPGHWAGFILNVSPYLDLAKYPPVFSGVLSAVHSRLSGMSGGLNSLGTGWGSFCGTAGKPACSNSACQAPATNVNGMCQKLCGGLHGACCTVGPACGDGTAGNKNDVDVTCFNPVIGSKNCQACGGSGEDCCGPNQTCHIDGQTCGYVLFQGDICHTPYKPGGGGGGGTPACSTPRQQPCGIGNTSICPAGFHAMGFTNTAGCPGPVNMPNSTICNVDCGSSYKTCDTQCNAALGYHLLSGSSKDVACNAPGQVGGASLGAEFTCSK